jgi:hypothetical protein
LNQLVERHLQAVVHVDMLLMFETQFQKPTRALCRSGVMFAGFVKHLLKFMSKRFASRFDFSSGPRHVLSDQLEVRKHLRLERFLVVWFA